MEALRGGWGAYIFNTRRLRNRSTWHCLWFIQGLDVTRDTLQQQNALLFHVFLDFVIVPKKNLDYEKYCFPTHFLSFLMILRRIMNVLRFPVIQIHSMFYRPQNWWEYKRDVRWMSVLCGSLCIPPICFSEAHLRVSTEDDSNHCVWMRQNECRLQSITE